MVRIKFGDSVPFPDKPGMWLRLVLGDSPKNEERGSTQDKSVVITQGHVMLFQGERVILMDKGQETTPEVLQQGDQRCAADGLTVSYTPIAGVGITRKANQSRQPPTNGNGA